MNWQARPQRPGSLLREMPQSVQSSRGSADASGGRLSDGSVATQVYARYFSR